MLTLDYIQKHKHLLVDVHLVAYSNGIFEFVEGDNYNDVLKVTTIKQFEKILEYESNKKRASITT